MNTDILPMGESQSEQQEVYIPNTLSLAVRARSYLICLIDSAQDKNDELVKTYEHGLVRTMEKHNLTSDYILGILSVASQKVYSDRGKRYGFRPLEPINNSTFILQLMSKAEPLDIEALRPYYSSTTED